MKKLFTILFFVVACLQSCVFYIIDPQGPSQPSDWQPRMRDTIGDIENPGQKTDSVIASPKDTVIVIYEPPTSTDDDPIPDFVPTSKYDSINENGVMTFNVYLGWNVSPNKPVVMIRDFPSYGGVMFFNIYTNNKSMSMYGFEKFRKDFYTFSDEPPYCGYDSYSIDTKSVCRYKMIITPNNTGEERVCVGYWACNDGGYFYSSFKIILSQSYK